MMKISYVVIVVGIFHLELCRTRQIFGMFY